MLVGHTFTSNASQCYSEFVDSGHLILVLRLFDYACTFARYAETHEAKIDWVSLCF